MDSGVHGIRMNTHELRIDKLCGDVSECLISNPVGPLVFARADHKHRCSVARQMGSLISTDRHQWHGSDDSSRSGNVGSRGDRGTASLGGPSRTNIRDVQHSKVIAVGTRVFSDQPVDRPLVNRTAAGPVGVAAHDDKPVRRPMVKQVLISIDLV